MIRNIRRGFTLIELSLSLVFISVLSIAVTLIVTNSIAAYHRGLVLNQLNTVGMELVNDMQAAVQNAPAISVKAMCSTIYNDGDRGSEGDCQKDEGRKFVSIMARGDVFINERAFINNVPLYGAFCTGSYSYIWNSGYFFDDNNDGNQYAVNGQMAEFKFTYLDSSDGKNKVGERGGFRLLKVKDEKRSVCVSAVRSLGEYKNANLGNVFDITQGEDNNFGMVDENPEDVMAANGGLALYDLDAAAPVVDGAINNMFYAVSFILGTVQGGINVTSGDYCAVPEDAAQSSIEAFDYCAINKFNFAAQSTGGGGE